MPRINKLLVHVNASTEKNRHVFERTLLLHLLLYVQVELAQVIPTETQKVRTFVQSC